MLKVNANEVFPYQYNIQFGFEIIIIVIHFRCRCPSCSGSGSPKQMFLHLQTGKRIHLTKIDISKRL